MSIVLLIVYVAYCVAWNYVDTHMTGSALELVQNLFYLCFPLPVVLLALISERRKKSRVMAGVRPPSVTEVKLDPKGEVFETLQQALLSKKAQIDRLEAEIKHEWALWAAIERH